MVQNSAQVLLVEDNPMDIILVQRAFRAAQLNYDLKIASDTDSALNALVLAGLSEKRAVLLPHLIFIDIRLTSALDLLKEIKFRPYIKMIPTLIFTLSDNDPLIEKIYQLGGNGYICKAVDAQQFMADIQKRASYWLMKAKEHAAVAQSSR